MPPRTLFTAEKRPRGESTHAKAKQQLLGLERRLNNEDLFPNQLKWTGCLEGCTLSIYESPHTGKTLYKFLTLSDVRRESAADLDYWLAYYAHVSVVRSMRAVDLSWEPLSAQRTTNLIVIEALADTADSEVIALAVVAVPRYARSRAIVGIRDGIIIPAASGLARIGVLGAIFRFFGVARLFFLALVLP